MYHFSRIPSGQKNSQPGRSALQTYHLPANHAPCSQQTTGIHLQEHVRAVCGRAGPSGLRGCVFPVCKHTALGWSWCLPVPQEASTTCSPSASPARPCRNDCLWKLRLDTSSLPVLIVSVIGNGDGGTVRVRDNCQVPCLLLWSLVVVFRYLFEWTRRNNFASGGYFCSVGINSRFCVCVAVRVGVGVEMRWGGRRLFKKPR